MSDTKVVEWVDIQAPREAVFSLVTDLRRRMQLSPLWGIARIETISPEYPQVGSSYHVRVVEGSDLEYDTIITGYQPGRTLSYCTDLENTSHITWTVQDIAQGTRVIYEESFNLEAGSDIDLQASVRQVVKEWLANIKRYAELKNTPSHRLIKWFLDRYYLNMRRDQRKTVLVVLFMHIVGLISFIMAAIALGISTLLT